MAINKVVYGNNTLVDLTEDTVTENKVLEGETFHDASGQKRTGSLVIPVQDVEVNGESVVDENGIAEVVVPVSGDVSTTDFFESYTGGKVKSLQMELSPIQDLHGYDSPWVGGSRKNKLPLTVENLKAWNTSGTWSGNSYERLGMIFTILTDDANNVISIDINGTTTSYPAFIIFKGTLNGSYILCRDNARGRVYVNGSQVNDGTSDYSFTASGETYEINLFTGAVTLNHQIVKPMLVLSTETDYTFAPYENICPISGHTEAKALDDGKNKANISSSTVGSNQKATVEYDNNIIRITATGTYARCGWLIPVEVGKTYTFSCKGITSAIGGTMVNIIYLGSADGTWNPSSPNYISHFQLSTELRDVNITFTATTNVCFIGAYVTSTATSGVMTLTDVQLELGSTTTPYVPYNGYQVTVNLGGTYYSGVLDIVTGVFVLDKAKAVTPTRGALDSSGKLYTINFSGGIIHNYNSTAIATPYVMCSHLDVDSLAGARDTRRKCICQYAGAIFIGGYVGEETALDNMLESADFSIVFELATPQTIQLTPQQILAIIGENHFSAPLEQQEIIEIIARNIAEFNEVIDDENISDKFTYSSEKLEDRLDEYVDKDAVEEKSATTEFTTINGGLLSSLKVSLSPVQNLHGYSKPWIGGAGKNLINQDGVDTNNGYKHKYYITQYGTEQSASGDWDILEYVKVEPSTTYTISGITPLPSNGLAEYDENKQLVNAFALVSTPFTFTTTANTHYIRTNRQYTTDDSIQLEKGSTATDYERYENICLISGHTQVDVDISNPNLVEEMQVGVWLGTTGNYSAVASYCCSKKFRIAPNNTYNVFATANATIGTDNAVLFYDENDNYLGENTGGLIKSTTVPFTFTAPSNAYYCALDLKVPLSNLLTAEIVADKEQVTVNLGGTYYSGTLDVVSGKLTDDGKKAVCVLDGTEGFSKSSTYQGSFYRNWNYFNPTGKVNGQIKCSHAKFVTLASGEYAYGKCTSDNSLNLWLGQPEWTTTDFHNYLATQYANGTPVTIEYEVNSPTETETQLSPTMVKALVGENHLSAPLGGQEITEAKYKEMFDFGDVLEVIGEDYFTLPLQTFTFTNKICNVNDNRVTSNSLVDVYFTSASMSSVEDAGITVESQNGKIVMTAEEQPVGTIQGRIKVVN